MKSIIVNLNRGTKEGCINSFFEIDKANISEAKIRFKKF